MSKIIEIMLPCEYRSNPALQHVFQPTLQNVISEGCRGCANANHDDDTCSEDKVRIIDDWDIISDLMYYAKEHRTAFDYEPKDKRIYMEIE